MTATPNSSVNGLAMLLLMMPAFDRGESNLFPIGESAGFRHRLGQFIDAALEAERHRPKPRHAFDVVAEAFGLTDADAQPGAERQLMKRIADKLAAKPS